MNEYRLVVCEKPSVARSIAAVLGAGRRGDGFLSGGGYLVSWCFGHLAELSDADAYDEKYGKWRREDLPILPESWQYTVARDKQKQMNTLRALMHREDVCEVVNACEGSVKLIVAEREPEELKGNSFVQNLLLDTQNGITKLSVETETERDTIRLIRFMMEDGRSLNETTGSSRIYAA